MKGTKLWIRPRLGILVFVLLTSAFPFAPLAQAERGPSGIGHVFRTAAWDAAGNGDTTLTSSSPTSTKEIELSAPIRLLGRIVASILAGAVIAALAAACLHPSLIWAKIKVAAPIVSAAAAVMSLVPGRSHPSSDCPRSRRIKREDGRKVDVEEVSHEHHHGFLGRRGPSKQCGWYARYKIVRQFYYDVYPCKLDCGGRHEGKCAYEDEEKALRDPPPGQSYSDEPEYVKKQVYEDHPELIDEALARSKADTLSAGL